MAVERINPGKHVTWRTVVGILLVPLAIGGLLVWGLWSPVDRLDTVKAAVVNNDKAVQVGGQSVMLGRQLVSGLVTGRTGLEAADATAGAPVADVSGSTTAQNFTWVITDASDAAAGLADGSYTAAVTIPEGFSAAATSTASADTAHQATIDVQVSPKSKVLDTVVSDVVVQTATKTLNTALTENYLKNIYVGFGTLGSKLGEAATGATSLADGQSKLAAGAKDLSTGTTSLASGVGQVASGTQSLSAGVGQLATGSSSLAGGVSSLASGATSLSGGVGQLSSGAKALSDGLGPLSTNLATASTGLTTLSGGATQLTDGLGKAAAGSEKLGDAAAKGAQAAAGADTAAKTVAGNLAALAKACPAAAGEAYCAQVKALADGVGSTSSSPPSLLYLTGASAQAAAGVSGGLTGGDAALVPALKQLASGGAQLSGGLTQASQGVGTISGYLTQSAQGASQLATGAASAATGAKQLAGGASSAATGASQLASGAASASSGSQQLAQGATSAADGATKLADGATSLASGAEQAGTGTSQLADGLHQAAGGVPGYPKDQSASLAKVVATPVVTSSGGETASGIGAGFGFGYAQTALFAIVALWAGALAAYLILRPFPSRSALTTESSLRLAVTSYLPGLAIGVAEGVIATIALGLSLDLSFAQWAGTLAVTVVAGAAFMALNQGLAAMFGGFGRLVSLFIAVVGLAAGLISTVPGVLTTIDGYLPISSAVAGLQLVAHDSFALGGTLFALVLWLLLGIGLSLAAVARLRFAPLHPRRYAVGAAGPERWAAAR